VAAPKARILLSVDCRKMDARDLEDTARYAVRLRGDKAHFSPVLACPIFPIMPCRLRCG
jgi:hypothetical protein